MDLKRFRRMWHGLGQWRCQVCPQMELIMRADPRGAARCCIDLAAINGAGTRDCSLRGILQTQLASVRYHRNEGRRADTISNIVGDLETAVAVESTRTTGSLGYLTNTKVRGQLKRPKCSTGTNGNRSVAERRTPAEQGYRAGVTNQVPADLTKGTAEDICSAIIFRQLAGPV